MSSLAQALETPTQPESVTTISAVARVDYILRFSKQAVMVVDEQIALCSSVGSQFLSNLSSNNNAAYITMSAKLNDLQVRCRIIEQLFGNTLFDPEQSVAVSLINLVKKHQQPVSIVIDNAQLLSLQLTHELCQLAEIAKKSDHQISILMLSTLQGGLKVSQNQSLFNKKLTIISAQSGQLISHNSKLFKPATNYLAITPMKKWLAFFLVLALVATASVYLLFKRDVFSFSAAISQLTETQQNTEIEQLPEAFVQVSESANQLAANVQQASASDIFISLVEEPIVKAIIDEKPPEAAQPVDIINAIEAFTVSVGAEEVNSETSMSIATINSTSTSQETSNQESSLINTNRDIQLNNALLGPEQGLSHKENAQDNVENIVEPIIELTEENSTKGISAPIKVTNVSNSVEQPVLENAQYQGQLQGFVIQIAGFTQQNVLDEFLADFNELSFFQYKRLVNNEVMTILTTEYYLSREQAERAFAQLPLAIKDRSPWIKAISTINDEINHFQRSQSERNQVTIPAS